MGKKKVGKRKFYKVLEGAVSGVSGAAGGGLLCVSWAKGGETHGPLSGGGLVRRPDREGRGGSRRRFGFISLGSCRWGAKKK